MHKCYWLILYFIVGFVGDIGLQYLIAHGWGQTTAGFGLISYFEQHGKVESPFIAAAMMASFAYIYLFVLRLPMNIMYMAVYSVLLDYIFRKLMIFPSLYDYYDKLGYLQSAIWAIIPMLLPVFVYRVLGNNLSFLF